jgi:hypothetical protein
MAAKTWKKITMECRVMEYWTERLSPWRKMTDEPTNL